MRKGKIIAPLIMIPVLVGAVLLGACTGGRNTPPNTALNENHSAMDHPAETTNGEAAYRIEFKSAPDPLEANQPSTLTFSVKDKQGAIVKDLQIVHEKTMHLLIVSKDLAEFYHVHPEPSADGSYRVQHTFPNGGDYKLYADFTPANAPQVVEQIDVTVAGQERAKVTLVPDTKFEKTVDSLKVVMKPSASITAGQEMTLDFQAFDSGSGKAATDLENYLGELAHFVIISEDLKDFVHAHPMAKGEFMDSMKMGDSEQGDHGAAGHTHSADEGERKQAGESEVSAHTTFPRAGIYKLWAQFKRRGKVITVPFIVNVPAGKSEPVKAANVPTGYTQITVSEKGFEPASVNAKVGTKVLLAFYRSDAENCGSEVVFAEQTINKNLPLGETVLVELTPTKAGDIAFACGMDMLKGKLVVSEN
ncbi:MAG: cupredoxin domain-containing protein [Acidobacteria bacterium]|nr:cupredoxin domain-containing protein [Acidobacteriota bacterium]